MGFREVSVMLVLLRLTFREDRKRRSLVLRILYYRVPERNPLKGASLSDPPPSGSGLSQAFRLEFVRRCHPKPQAL